MPRITDARVIVTSPGRNFVVPVIECDDRTTGLGDATLDGRQLSVASHLSDRVVPCRIGSKGGICSRWAHGRSGVSRRRW